MSILQKTFFCFFLLLASFSTIIGKEDHKVQIQQDAYEKAIVLPGYGILKQKQNGFIYLDVSNEFITEIVPLLEMPGVLKERPTSVRSIGAHISVFHEKENISPDELGAAFSFSVKDIRNFTLHTRDGLKKIWVISVISEDLEALREKYGCSPKLKGFEFHISLGKQMPKAPENWEEKTSLSEFNFSSEETLGLFQDGDFFVVECDQVIKTAAKVDAIGQLKLKGNGYVYLDVNNQYVDEICEILPIQGDFKKLSTDGKKIGAHISVFYEDEMIKHEIWDLKEAGDWFTFEVKELRYICKKTANGEKKTWLLVVDAPALERLRAHYGLKPKLLGHDFHMTLGHEFALPMEIQNESFEIDLEESAA